MSQDGFFGQDRFRGVSPSLTDSVAFWSLLLCRYFLVDPTNGDDGNIGYVDAVPGSTIDPTGKAKKTQAGLMAILPRNGCGRDAVILYINSDHANGVTVGAMDFAGVFGYRYFRKSGSTDGTNSATDQIRNGFRIGAAGPNPDGSWTVAAGATTLTLTVAAGSLPAEVSSGGITGWRIRFATGALAATNTTRTIRRNVTTTTLGWELITGSAPANGDTFFIERPGIRTPFYCEMDGASLVRSQATGTAMHSPVTTGIEVTGTTIGSCKLGNPGFCTYVGFHVSGATDNAVLTTGGAEAGSIETRTSYSDETGLVGTPVTRSVGMAMRIDCLGRLKANQLSFGSLTTTRLRAPTSATNLSFEANSLFWQSGVTRGCRLIVTGLGSSVYAANSGSSSGSFSSIGVQSGAASLARLRILDSSILVRGSLQIWGVTHEGTGTASAILLGNSSASTASPPEAMFVSIDDFIDEPGFVSKTTGVALDVSNMKLGGTVRVGVRAPCTASGGAGQILAAPAPGFLQIPVDWTILDSTNVPDFNNTNLVGTAGIRIPLGSCRHVRTNEATVAVAGDVVRPFTIPNFVVRADASALPAEHEVAGIMITSFPPAGGEGLMWVGGGSPFVNTEVAAAEGRTLYLSATTPGKATTTVPINNGVNRKLRLGACGAAVASPQGAFVVAWAPDTLSTVSDAAR